MSIQFALISKSRWYFILLYFLIQTYIQYSLILTLEAPENYDDFIYGESDKEIKDTTDDDE